MTLSVTPEHSTLRNLLWVTLLPGIVAFAAALTLIPYGLDVTDSGWGLAKQYFYFTQDNFSPALALIWLSDLAGAMWLNLHGTADVYWARFGWAAMSAVNAAMTGVIMLRTGSRPMIASLLALTGSAVVISHNIHLIDYVSVPGFLLNTALLIMACSLTSSPRKSIGYFFAGFILGVAIHARFPLVVLFILAPCLLFFEWLWSRKRSTDHLNNCLMLFLGQCAGFLILTQLFKYSPFKTSYFDVVISAVNGNETPPPLAFYFRQCLEFLTLTATRIVVPAAIAFGAWLTLSRFTRMDKSRLNLFCTLLVFLLVTSFLADYSASIERIATITIGTLATAAFILISFTVTKRCAVGRASAEHRWLMSLMMTSLLFSLALGAGSAQALISSYSGLWALLPFILRELIKMSKTSRYEVISDSMPGLLSGVGAAIVAMVLIWSFYYPYRDRPRSQLTAHSTSPDLDGIFTSPERVAAIDDLLAQLKPLLAKDEPLLAYPSLPMIHFLTKSPPAVGNPWVNIIPVSLLKQNLVRIDATPPKTIVRSTVDTQNFAWDLNDGASGFNALEQALMVDEWTAAKGYSVYWTSKHFKILRLPDKTPN